jgi:hypothetical protein
MTHAFDENCTLQKVREHQGSKRHQLVQPQKATIHRMPKKIQFLRKSSLPKHV